MKLGVELTITVVPELRDLLCAILDDGGTQVVLDFSKTKSLDTAGLGLLLAARNSFSEGGKSLSLIHVSQSVHSLLATLRLSQSLNVRMG